MNINTIFTYALVILTGMIMATFAAYYLLNEFIYPKQQTSIENEIPVVAVPPEQNVQEVETTSTEPATQVVTTTIFSGTLEAVNTGCFADGECFITVDGKHVTAIMGWSQDIVGSIQGVDGFGDLENYLGKQVEVSALDLGDAKYTLYGSEAFYIKVLE